MSLWRSIAEFVPGMVPALAITTGENAKGTYKEGSLVCTKATLTKELISPSFCSAPRLLKSGDALCAKIDLVSVSGWQP